MFYAYYTTQLYNVLHLSCTTDAVRDVVHSTFRGHWLLRLVRNGRTNHGGWFGVHLSYSKKLFVGFVAVQDNSLGEGKAERRIHASSNAILYNSRNGQLQF